MKKEEWRAYGFGLLWGLLLIGGTDFLFGSQLYVIIAIIFLGITIVVVGNPWKPDFVLFGDPLKGE